MNISRFGAYGIVLQNEKILLTQKKSGPYKALWGLPGGRIEFGETPEEALKRELIEETALSFNSFLLECVATVNTQYHKDGVLCDFHHIGIIYNVYEIQPVLGCIPEEEIRWTDLNSLCSEELTPFAKHALLKIIY